MATPTRQPKVLLVDDNPHNLLALESLIAKDGIATVLASSGREALLRVEHEDVGVVLLDVMMPVMDGFETARRIRALPNRPQPLLAFLTAATLDQDSVVLGCEIGALDFLTKPLEAKVLLAKVKRWLELAQRLAQPSALGILPTCCYCKSIRDPEDAWHQPDEYWRKRLNVQFSYGICPECQTHHVLPELQQYLRNRAESRSETHFVAGEQTNGTNFVPHE